MPNGRRFKMAGTVFLTGGNLVPSSNQVEKVAKSQRFWFNVLP